LLTFVTATKLTRAIHETPFAPFEIIVSDGRELGVPTRDHIAYPGGRVVSVMHDAGTGSVLDVLLISQLRMGGSIRDS